MSLTKVSYSMITGAPANVLDYGADPTGVANSTAAIQTAIDAGGSVFLPNGTYLIDTLIFPNSTSDAIPTGRSFVGSPQVILQQRTANTVLITKVANTGRLYNWTFGPFCVKPHATGSTVSAIKTTGMTGCVWNEIEGLSNGSQGFYAVMELSASPYLSYASVINNFRLVGTTGYTKGIWLTDEGTGAGQNPNRQAINEPFIYNNTGLSVALDVNKAYGVTINSPTIEANASATAIAMGVATLVLGGSLESNANDFNYIGDVGSRVQQTTVIGTTLANAHTIDFGNVGFSNVWMGVAESAPSPWINAPYSNRKVNYYGTNNPADPVFTQIQGTAGTIVTPFVSTVSSDYNPFTQMVTSAIRFRFNPGASGVVGISLTPPTGFNVASVVYGAQSLLDGTPRTLSTTYDAQVFINFPNTDPTYINCWVTFIKRSY
jgi:Pectate lyase superfamily protein